MLYRRKLSAFTLSETLIGLVLMVIIIGLAGSILNIASKNIQLIKENELCYQELEQLELIMTLDMNSHNKMKLKDSTLFFINQIDTIKYQFKHSYSDNKTLVIREKDTLSQQGLIYTTFKSGAISYEDIDAIKLKSIVTENFIFLYKKEDLQTKLLQYGF